MMQEDNEFMQYERITDTLMFLSNEFSLDFTVILGKKDKEGYRSFFHYETGYTSTRYKTPENLLSIKRNLTFYWVINNRADFMDGMILQFNDVACLTQIIEQNVLPWYFGANKIFTIADNKLTIPMENKSVQASYVQSNSKYLAFRPFVYTLNEGLGKSYKEGVRVNVNREDTYFDITIDTFMKFYQIIKTTDMYAVAANNVLYAKTPPYKTNFKVMSGLGGGKIDDSEWNTEIETHNKKSFVDKVKEDIQ